jgi:predicted secreted protein
MHVAARILRGAEKSVHEGGGREDWRIQVTGRAGAVTVELTYSREYDRT